MAIQKEIWARDIKDELFSTNEHVMMSQNHDDWVDNKTVHVPQSGASPNVVINRATVPATIAERTDTDLTYNLDEFTTDPILVRNLDELQTSYGKRQSVMRQHIGRLRQDVGDQVYFRWAQDVITASNRIILTSGPDSTFALAPTATGTRKALTVEDISKAAAQFDDDNVVREGRNLGIPPYMYRQLVNSEQLLDASRRGEATITNGVVNKIHGFNILVRSRVNVYDAGGVIKAVGAAAAVDDNLGAFAWQEESVAKALGTIDVMSDSGDNGNGKPEYYGSILSALVMLGAKNLRSDLKGLAAIVQTA